MKDLKQYGGIDILKFFMAICVIAIHVHPLENVANTSILNVYGTIVGCAVPFFFIVSGFFLYSEGVSELGSKMIKAAKKFIKLYFIWTLIYLPISIAGFVYQDLGLVKSILVFVRGVIFFGENQNSWILWYIMSSIYSLLIIYILSTKFKLNIATIFMFSVLCWLCSKFIFNPKSYGMVDMGYLGQIINTLFVWCPRVSSGFFYISMGLLLARYRCKIPQSKIVNRLILPLILLVFISCSAYPILPSLISIPCSSVLFFLISYHVDSSNALTFALRKASTVMYFMHMIIFTLLSAYIANSFASYGLVEFLIVLTLSLVMSLVVILCKKKSKFLNLIFP